jgi:hypothetical protein
MKAPKRWVLAFTLLAILALAALLGVRRLMSSGQWTMRQAQLVPLDYFLEPKSFSEIESTKAVLDALAAQSISDARIRSSSVTSGPRSQGRAAAVLDAVTELDQRIAEFKGTEQELLLVREQLIRLHQAKLYDRWLDVYLTALYERPTHSLVGMEARRALVIAKEVGREMDVIAGLQHVRSIPFPFESKRLIEAALPDPVVASQSAKADEGKLL